MRTVGWLLFSPLVVTMLIKKSVPEDKLLNVKVLHILKKSSIKTFRSETFGKLPFSHTVYRKDFMLKSYSIFTASHGNNLLCLSTNVNEKP